MRQCARYCNGGSPTNSVNRAANAERDIATDVASRSTVHGSAGRAWISRSAAPMAGSATAPRPHTDASTVELQKRNACTNSKSASRASGEMDGRRQRREQRVARRAAQREMADDDRRHRPGAACPRHVRLPGTRVEVEVQCGHVAPLDVAQLMRRPEWEDHRIAAGERARALATHLEPRAAARDHIKTQMRAFGNLETPRYPEIDLAKNRRAQVDSFQHLPDNVHC